MLRHISDSLTRRPVIGNRYDHQDAPTLLLGGARAGPGAAEPCLEFPKDTRLGDLHLGLLARMEVVGVSLGDAWGPLELG